MITPTFQIRKMRQRGVQLLFGITQLIMEEPGLEDPPRAFPTLPRWAWLLCFLCLRSEKDGVSDPRAVGLELLRVDESGRVPSLVLVQEGTGS